MRSLQIPLQINTALKSRLKDSQYEVIPHSVLRWQKRMCQSPELLSGLHQMTNSSSRDKLENSGADFNPHSRDKGHSGMEKS